DQYTAADQFTDHDEYEADTGVGYSDEDQANFSPDATVPLISFDEMGTGAAESVKSGDPDHPDQAGGPDAAFANTEFPADESSGGFREDDPVSEENADSTPKKSSAGKYIAILGGLGALLLLVLVSALAIGWYLTSRPADVPNDNANVTTPTVEPTVEQTPEEDPTPANTNEDTLGDNVNSNSTDDSNSNTADTNTETTDTQSTTDTGKTNPVPRPTRTPSTVRTPRPSATTKPTAARTPRPAPTKKPKDPGILQ
ncbi:MAG: hypothetical protein KDB79_03835, partial [Acidobacteria bacterium]|nr:hypothetical protein [Acidobacteriota bacterium]